MQLVPNYRSFRNPASSLAKLNIPLQPGTDFENKQHYDLRWILSRSAETGHRAELFPVEPSTRTLSGRANKKSLKFAKADSAYSFAKRALELDPDHKQARLNLIISLGLLSDASTSPSEKFRNAMCIRREAENLLLMDSLFSPAYYVLGKWHYELSKLTWVEKLACNTLLAKSVRFFVSKSLQFYERLSASPDYISITTVRGNIVPNTTSAIAVLESAIHLPSSIDDVSARELSKLLTSKTNQRDHTFL